ncbi:unnamed protein product [Prorocentrum cordatum]|uniref:Uncharacterized protein n=1 Tax=Prorocentrum cordatum TaxID=2364126 RepID=A0ABN9VCK6_9DINO|nr:unnamed protein product [Polarella glacialis]
MGPPPRSRRAPGAHGGRGSVIGDAPRRCERGSVGGSVGGPARAPRRLGRARARRRPMREGLLETRGPGRVGRWERRWFRVADGRLERRASNATSAGPAGLLRGEGAPPRGRRRAGEASAWLDALEAAARSRGLAAREAEGLDEQQAEAPSPRTAKAPSPALAATPGDQDSDEPEAEARLAGSPAGGELQCVLGTVVLVTMVVLVSTLRWPAVLGSHMLIAVILLDLLALVAREPELFLLNVMVQGRIKAVVAFICLGPQCLFVSELPPVGCEGSWSRMLEYSGYVVLQASGDE